MSAATATTPAATATSRARLDWPDIAKGACIVLVVLHHATKLFVVDLVPAELGSVSVAWAEVTGALKPIRMPLFFLISGFFAAGAVTRPWADARARIVGGYWLYAVWLTVFWAIYSLDTVMPANRTQDLGDYFGELMWAATSMWFLYAMVLYFVVAKVLRVLPAPVVLAAALALSLAKSWYPFEEANRAAVLFHFVFFLAGAYYPQVVRRLGANPLPAGLLSLLYVALTVGTTTLGWPRSLQVVALSLVGIPLGIAWAVRAARVSWLAGPLVWLGQRTLRVYVLHFAVLSAVGHLSLDLGDGLSTTSILVSGVFPLALTAVTLMACLALHEALRLLGFGFLFAAPAALVGRGSDQALRTGTGQPAAEGVAAGNVPSFRTS
ncbi:hypothetical protein GCM10027020_25390 [Nocardioides salsibiostraticola]